MYKIMILGLDFPQPLQVSTLYSHVQFKDNNEMLMPPVASSFIS